MTDNPAIEAAPTPAAQVPDPNEEEGSVPATPGPTWYHATPARLVGVIVTGYRTHMTAYGLKPMRIELIAMRAEDSAKAKLAGEAAAPPDEALRTAFPVVAAAFAEAMEYYGVFAWAIDALEGRAREEMEETISDHLQYRHRTAQSPGLAEGDGVQLPAEDGSGREEAAGEDLSGG